MARTTSTSIQFEFLESLRKLSQSSAVQVLSAMHRMNEARDALSDKLGIRPPSSDVRETLADLLYRHAQLHTRGIEAVLNVVPGRHRAESAQTKKARAGETVEFRVAATCTRSGGAKLELDVTPLRSSSGRRATVEKAMEVGGYGDYKLHEDGCVVVSVFTKGLAPGTYTFGLTLLWNGAAGPEQVMTLEIVG